jgi:hypothetical protein
LASKSKRKKELYGTLEYFCLFTAIEFLFKAIIVYADPKFADYEKLKNCFSHNYQKLINKIRELEITEEVRLLVEAILDSYNLGNIDVQELKYPYLNRLTAINYEPNEVNKNKVNKLLKYLKGIV